MKDFILCCDWGTSSFRLRLVDVKTIQIQAEVVSDDGIAHTYNCWEEIANKDRLNREDYFRQQLNTHIKALSAGVNFSLDHIPVVISGMASSSLGMKELPYATIPFAMDGSQASVAYFEPQADFPHEIILISGVKSDQDVMRGEETQLVGLIHLLGLSGVNTATAIYIFPGTHSKHIQVQKKRLVAFQTFMTGEVFSILANQSILKDSITPKSDALNQVDIEAFKAGIQESENFNLLNSLFKVRTNHLFDTLDKPQNYYYLSGLLIGTELKTLQDKEGQLFLCSGNNLFELYKLAMEELGLRARTQTVPPDIIEKATIAGQIDIFQQHSPAIKIN
ncbi:2-dehydro-3-deoxygalactonokinase [Adhaeribacter aquaticus]|uniref:2-dehydro-3-deoxygalactonokinase n=1 Tax=Adhaeribacter aquaticus TaxID=299567 RepID=UPI00041AD726|nr:2-dehydro-3-deoxygalactonokinase [Adhaeribacter aquaticus]